MSHDAESIEDREERAALLALERLELGAEASSGATDGDPQLEALVREHLEVLGLLPRSLEPIAPRPAVKARLLARLASLEEAAAPPPAASVHDHFDDLTLVRGGRAHGQAPAAGERPAPPQRPAAWSLAMAAVLGFLVVGLGFLVWQVSQQSAIIAQLSERLERTYQGEAQARAEAIKLRDDLEMVTTTARQVYPMRPVGPEPMLASSAPRGVLYVCGFHQRWYMSLQDLQPAPGGHQYYLWFLGEDEEPMEGRPFEVGPDATAELDAPSMPSGTRAFMVTLESAGPHERPEGEVVILGDRPVRL